MLDNKNFINSLLVALESEEIIDKISSVLGLHVKESLKTSDFEDNIKVIESLREEIDRNDQLISGLKEQLQRTENAYYSLKSEYAEVKDRSEKLESLYRNTYNENLELKTKWKEATECYHAYLSLSVGVKDSLRGIFKGDTFEQFVICGVQYENIESLWDFIKVKLMEENNTDTFTLIKIFNYFLHAYNVVFDQPLFMLEETKEGQQFDHDIHIRTGSSKVMGPISEVLLHGFRNTKTNKLIKKSLVKV